MSRSDRSLSFPRPHRSGPTKSGIGLRRKEQFFAASATQPASSQGHPNRSQYAARATLQQYAARATLCLSCVVGRISSEHARTWFGERDRHRGDPPSTFVPIPLRRERHTLSLARFTAQRSCLGTPRSAWIPHSRYAQPVTGESAADRREGLRRFPGSARSPESIFARAWPPRPPGRPVVRSPAAAGPACR